MSVVIPTYERCDVITRAVDSVLRPNMGAFEVIVVDDGSTDSTQRVLDLLDDNRLSYVSSTHLGAAAARNIGARRAQARWLTFLDSDDTVTSDWLSSMLAETSRPHTALVSCGYAERADGGAVMRKVGVQPHESAVAGLVDASDGVPGRRRRFAVDTQISLGAALDGGVAHVDADMLRLPAAQLPDFGSGKA